MTFPSFVLLLLAGIGVAHQVEASSVQDQAEFLAGMPLSQDSPLFSLQKSSEYRAHAKELQDQWQFCRRIRYDAMQQWGREHLAHDISTRGVVRYLFGGPDFLNAHAFFPEARVMVLGGLEPAGEMPPPETLNPEALAVGLKSLRNAIHTSLFCGYFITSEMKPQLLEGSFRGVLPVLFTELALTGHQIVSVEAVKPFGSPGIKILYERYDPRADTQPQTLYYFQADLSNGPEGNRFLDWLNTLGDGASYLKAASYLLPLDSFSQARTFLLKTSTLILQDDSGIPFHDFHPDLWRIQLFGVYVQPLPIFKLRKESDLDTAYHSGDYASPLPFGAGYHVNAHDANLLLAIRSNAPSEGVALPSAITPQLQQPAPPPVPARTPKPKHMRIRKALPVEIRKALPVDTPLSTAPIPLGESTGYQVKIDTVPGTTPIPEAAPLPASVDQPQ